MRTSDQIDEIIRALVKCQAAFPPLKKSKTANVPTKSGGEYSYSYADLCTVLEGVGPTLREHGVAIIQAVDMDTEGEPVLMTRVVIESGQYVEAVYPLPSGATAQEMGSAITYARRYSLGALLGVTAEDDDDGAASGSRTRARRASAPAPAQAQAQTPVLVDGRDPGERAAAILAMRTLRDKWPDDPRVRAVSRDHSAEELQALIDTLTDATAAKKGY